MKIVVANTWQISVNVQSCLHISERSEAFEASRQQIYYSGTSVSTFNNIFKHINISRTYSEI